MPQPFLLSYAYLYREPVPAGTVPDFKMWANPSPRSSSPREFHPQALTDPYVNLSIHTALLNIPCNTACFDPSAPPFQLANVSQLLRSPLRIHLRYRGFFATTGDSAPRNRPWYFCPCGCCRLDVSLPSRFEVPMFPALSPCRCSRRLHTARPSSQ